MNNLFDGGSFHPANPSPIRSCHQLWFCSYVPCLCLCLISFAFLALFLLTCREEIVQER